MIRLLRQAIAVAPFISLAFALALGLTLFFGFRMIAGAIYWANPDHLDQQIEGWMTPGYIAHSWRVPREVVLDALALNRDDGRPGPLRELAQTSGNSVDALAAIIAAAIDVHRAEALE